MKTVFITSFHALISRNILQTRILSDLLEAGLRVVLIVPSAKVSFFKKEFAHPNVCVEGVSVPKKTFEDALAFLSYPLVGVENHVIRGLKTEGSWLRYYFAHALHRLLSPFFFPHRLMRFFARTYLRTDAFNTLFETYKPDLIFTTDSFYREDRALIVEAKARGVKTIGMTRSWDNPTTKGVFLAVPDKIVATNDVVKEELVAIHHVPEETITVTGVPHYDVRPQASEEGRRVFFEELGLDSSKKTVLFAPGGKILYEHDDAILRTLKRLLDKGAFSEDIQFLVRIPPSDRIDTSPVEEDARFIIDDPGTNITGRKKESELSKKDSNRLEHSLLYSDVVLTLVSTMAIDGLVYGKPVIIFAYDAESGLTDPIEKMSKYMHFEKFLGTGQIAISHSETEFVEQMNRYLAHPEEGKEKRDALVRRYTYGLDGKASERVSVLLLRELGK